MSVSVNKGRSLKQQVLALLQEDDLGKCLDELIRLPARKVINPLFSFLLHENERTRWRAVTAFGSVVSNLADQDAESARVIMRRLMWSLNDESGGIGWGAPEAMAEAMARHGGVASEFGSILVSYMDPEGNFLEYLPLQRGLLWGLTRLAAVRPESVTDGALFLKPYLESHDEYIRGLAALMAGLIGAEECRSRLEDLTAETAIVVVYRDDTFARYTVGELAKEGLAHLDRHNARAR